MAELLRSLFLPEKAQIRSRSPLPLSNKFQGPHLLTPLLWHQEPTEDVSPKATHTLDHLGFGCRPGALRWASWLWGC